MMHKHKKAGVTLAFSAFAFAVVKNEDSLSRQRRIWY